MARKWPTFSADFGEPGAPKSGKLWRRKMAARTVWEVEVLPAPGMPVVKCAGEKCAEGGGAQIGPVVGNELASRRRGRSRCHVLWGCRWRNAPPAKARTAAARRSARRRPPGPIFGAIGPGRRGESENRRPEAQFALREISRSRRGRRKECEVGRCARVAKVPLVDDICEQNLHDTYSFNFYFNFYKLVHLGGPD